MFMYFNWCPLIVIKCSYTLTGVHVSSLTVNGFQRCTLIRRVKTVNANANTTVKLNFELEYANANVNSERDINSWSLAFCQSRDSNICFGRDLWQRYIARSAALGRVSARGGQAEDFHCESLGAHDSASDRRTHRLVRAFLPDLFPN